MLMTWSEPFNKYNRGDVQEYTSAAGCSVSADDSTFYVRSRRRFVVQKKQKKQEWRGTWHVRSSDISFGVARINFHVYVD